MRSDSSADAAKEKPKLFIDSTLFYVACAYLYLLDAAHALNEQIGDYHDNSLANPKATLQEALQQLRTLANDMDARWGASFYDTFSSAMRTCGDSVPSNYLPVDKA